MKSTRLSVLWIFILLIATAAPAAADTLFKGRQIRLNDPGNRIFSVGLTGTTAGFNFIALVEDARHQAISLGDLGYWERVPDPPSFLRNTDLQFVVENHAAGKFQIEFEYDPQQQDIRYRVKNGAVLVKIDAREYYPVLIIDTVESVARSVPARPAETDLKRVLLFDFNSFDVDLREHYGGVKRLMANAAFKHYFYYYEAADYSGYHFKIYPDVTRIDIDKMGLSVENDTLAYYQQVLENLKSRLGTDFADQTVMVTRFGKKYAPELNHYAREIGLRKHMEINFWSYHELE